MHERPGGAARLVEHVVDLQPRRLHDARVGRMRGLLRGRVAGEVGIDAQLADARGEALRHRTEALVDEVEVRDEVVGARVELSVLVVVVAEAREVGLGALQRVAVLALAGRQQPARVLVGKVVERFTQVGILDRLRLRSREIVAHGLREVAQLQHDALLPVRDVVHQHAGRRDVVREETAALVEQHVDGVHHRGRRDRARHDAMAVQRRMVLRHLHHVERVRLGIPPPHQREHDERVQREQHAERTQHEAGTRCGNDGVHAARCPHGRAT